MSVQYRTFCRTTRIDHSELTLQENLALLQQLGLVEVSGRGRGALWYIEVKTTKHGILPLRMTYFTLIP